MGSERLNGTVKWFNDQKGYGFITPSDGTEDLFVHQSAIRSDGFRSLADGETVEFQIETENNRTKAVDVTGPNEGPVQGTRGGSGGGGGRGGSRGGYGGGGRGGRGGGDGGCFKCGESEGINNGSGLELDRMLHYSTFELLMLMGSAIP
ncbi:hypothetical protein G4B88_010016 [Cannabis sativa]|uniref:CSD domain-containing protein n=1 Tax=Cannabis sativa TaxID=3483 RepID=A0A7J6E3N0_CANSA|nr:hypothetical protein G4B88_010016 [Cannabis sativa]